MVGCSHPANMSYNIYFDKTDYAGIKGALNTCGYCVARQVISPDQVQHLKDEIDLYVDPERTVPPASSKFHLTFAEQSRILWDLVEDKVYMDLRTALIGDTDVCLHRSAAILRTPGDPTGGWHSDHCGKRKGPKTHANDFLNRYSMPSGGWFYLNGSHPDRSGVAVIEYSHTEDWQPPEGFHMDDERRMLYRDGEDTPYAKLDMPGMIPVVADPGDLILFSALTLHVNMETRERRYSCGMAFRPKSIQVEVPWALTAAARQMIERLPEHLKHYTEGYTGIDVNWKP